MYVFCSRHVICFWPPSPPNNLGSPVYVFNNIWFWTLTQIQIFLCVIQQHAEPETAMGFFFGFLATSTLASGLAIYTIKN